MGWEIVSTARSEIQSGLPDPGIEERKEVEPCTLLGITVGQTPACCEIVVQGTQTSDKDRGG